MTVAWNSSADFDRPVPSADAAGHGSAPVAVDADAALVRRIAAGDGAAVHRLMDRFAGPLYGLARALTGNEADAEDVVQETFAAACEAAGSFRGEASVKTWLTKILVRRAARSRRAGLRWRFLSLSSPAAADEPPPAPASPGPASAVDSDMDVTVMLERLSPEHREVIVLRELQGLSYEEMAAALGVPRGTVESRLHRARRELREKFSGYFES